MSLSIHFGSDFLIASVDVLSENAMMGVWRWTIQLKVQHAFVMILYVSVDAI